MNAVQIREKDMPAADIIFLASAIRKAAKRKFVLIINERPDIALASGANGVHSPSTGLTAKQIKKISSFLLCGKSVHSVNEAVAAEHNGFDYIFFGPVFITPAKIKYGSPQGLKKLADVCKKVKIPVFAVGGINPERAKKCINAGASGIAVISDLMTANNIKLKVKEYQRAIGTVI